MVEYTDNCVVCGHRINQHVLSPGNGRRSCAAWFCNCSGYSSAAAVVDTINATSEARRSMVTKYATVFINEKDYRDYMYGRITINDLRSKYDIPKETIPMRRTASSSGSGKLTVSEMKKLLEDIPDDAILCLETKDDQRDGSWWNFTAEWGHPAEERHPYTTGPIRVPIPQREKDDASYSRGVPNRAQESQFGDH